MDGGANSEEELTDVSVEITGREVDKNRIRGGILVTVGYLLSPVSWWNDLFVNIPLAYAFGSIFGLISKDLFLPAMVAGYWITNILGFVLMHKGAKEIVLKKNVTGYSKRELAFDLATSVVYTMIVVILAVAGVLRLPGEYFP
jgi:hypothetical protein